MTLNDSDQSTLTTASTRIGVDRLLAILGLACVIAALLVINTPPIASAKKVSPPLSTANSGKGRDIPKGLTVGSGESNSHAALLSLTPNRIVPEAVNAESQLGLQVLSPPFKPIFRTTGAGFELTGTATGASTITQVVWSNNHGDSGLAKGGSSWRSGRIPLEIGTNEIEVTVTDIYNYSATTKLAVERIENSGEGNFSDDVRSSFYDGKPVVYSIVDGMAVFEGDIVLGTVDELESARRIGINSGGTYQNRTLWTNGIVPYTIGSNATSDVQAAINHWNSFTNVTGVTLVARTNQSNYVNFNRASGVCNSQVGMVGSRQDINYDVGCQFGGVVHEIGHAIGLWHEQSRTDRNTYVTVNFANIVSGQEHNFNQYGISGIDIKSYDYGSIMHYGAYDFSSNGQPTLVPTTSGVTIGQRNNLSAGDLNGVKFLYQCLGSGAQIGENTDGGNDQQTFVNAYTRNGDKSQVGCPLNTVHAWYQGRTQDYNGGSGGKGALMKGNGLTDSKWVHGAIWSYYDQHGGPNNTFWDGSKLGYPTTDEVRGANSSVSNAETSYNAFENGTINFYGTGTRAGQAYVVRGAILTKWSQACSALCYEAGPLGMPIGEEAAAAQSPFGTTGRYQDFESGQIYWHANGARQNQTFYVQHGIAEKYKTLGSGSSLGFPISNEYVSQGNARNDFEGGYIYWDGSQAIVVLNGQNYTINLSSSPSAGGTVTGGGTFASGSSRIVTATANTNYTFANWTENGSVVSSSASYTFTLTSNRTLVANFSNVPSLQPPTLVSPGTSAAPGSSIATLTPTFNWQQVTGADGYGLYVSRFNGSSYDLIFNSETDVGQPLTGTSYVFPAGRLQDGNQYRWNMSSHNSAGYGSPNTSRFYFSVSLSVQNYTITVSASPSGGGAVSGGGTFAAGSSRTVTATANTNYTFTNWTENGSVVSSSASYTFTLNGDRNLVANFTPTQVNYTITVSASPSVGGTVSGGGTFAAGSSRTVTATANAGYTFVNWTEGGSIVSSSATYTFTLNGNRTLAANFTIPCAGAQMTSPANGANIPSTTTFTWDTGTNNAEYWLQVGTTVGGSNIYSSSQLTGTSRTLSNLPVGQIYVRLSSRCASTNAWSLNDTSYTVLGCTSTPAQMTSPTNGASIPPSTTFTWNTGTGNSEYWLQVGTTPGGSQIYSASQLTGTSRTLSNLPNGTIYVRLSSRCAADSSWKFNDTSYTVVGCTSTPAQMTSPTNGSNIQSSTTFTWNAGTGNSEYWLQVGTTVGGSNIYSASQLTGTSRTLSNLPSGNIYVRLSSRCASSSAWSFIDYIYTGPPPCASAQMTSPATNGSSIPPSTTFTWNMGTGNSEYWLQVGTTVGGSQIYSASQLTGTSRTLSNLPSGNIYVRLSSRCAADNTWSFVDYSYTRIPCDSAQMTSPTNGASIPSTTTFTWNTGTGNSEYWLQVGTTVGGSEIYSASQLTGTSRTLSNLPFGNIYVTLSSRCAATNGWTANQYTYTGPDPRAQMISPVNSTILPSSIVTFNWSRGTGVSQYFLYVGNSQGSSEYFYSYVTDGSTTVSGIPTDGRTIYVRLWSLPSTGWTYLDYSYTACANCGNNQLAQIVTPANGTTFSSSAVTFNWNAGTGNSQYFLYVGNSRGSSEYFYNYISGGSTPVGGLPTDGRTIWVRIWSLNSQWVYIDYSYRAIGAVAYLDRQPPNDRYSMASLLVVKQASWIDGDRGW